MLREIVVVVSTLTVGVIVPSDTRSAEPKPVEIARDVLGPAIWCDDRTIVYAKDLSPDPATDHPLFRQVGIFFRTLPDGDEKRVYQDARPSPIATVPFYCAGDRLLVWTFSSPDCADAMGVVVAVKLRGGYATLACDAAAAFPSPDRHILLLGAMLPQRGPSL